MEIRKMTTFDITELKKLYEAVGWVVYTKDIATFEKMFVHSLAVYGAYTDERLIGIARVVGDNAHILYIQDLLVHPIQQRKGTGRQLLETVLETYEHVRQKVLITDLASSSTHHFYEYMGFKRAEALKTICFVRFD